MKEVFNNINSIIEKHINNSIAFNAEQGYFYYQNCVFYITCDIINDKYFLFKIDDHIHSGNSLIEEYSCYLNNAEVVFQCSTEQDVINSVNKINNFILNCKDIEKIAFYNDFMENLDDLDLDEFLNILMNVSNRISA